MKTLGQKRRLRQEGDLTERAWRVLQDSKELIQEKRAHAAMREQLLRRRDNMLREVMRDHRQQSPRCRLELGLGLNRGS